MEAWVIKNNYGDYWSEEFREFGSFNYFTVYPNKDIAFTEIIKHKLNALPVKVRIEEVKE